MSFRHFIFDLIVYIKVSCKNKVNVQSILSSFSLSIQIFFSYIDFSSNIVKFFRNTRLKFEILNLIYDLDCQYED